MKQHELNFVRVTRSDDPLWKFVERVMEEAFPPDERREPYILRKIVDIEPRFVLSVVFDGEVSVGNSTSPNHEGEISVFIFCTIAAPIPPPRACESIAMYSK